jgi:hypothetical protein
MLRILAIEEESGELIWHLAAYENLFLDHEMAEAALMDPASLKFSIPHMALTNRAFERTPTARLINRAISDFEKLLVENWKSDPNHEVSDRSVLLMMGLR